MEGGKRERERGRERGELGISGSSQLLSAGCLFGSVARDQQKVHKNEKFTNGNVQPPSHVKQIPGFKAIFDKNLNIPSCASYIEFKNLGLHNQLSYFIKQT